MLKGNQRWHKIVHCKKEISQKRKHWRNSYFEGLCSGAGPQSTLHITEKVFMCLQKCLPPEYCELNFLPVISGQSENSIVAQFVFKQLQFLFIRFWDLVAIVGAIYIMYSRQLPWGILISYCKWNEISFVVNISFLISNAISFLHGAYFIFSKFYFIHSWHLFHSPTAFISFVASFTSFTHSIYFICSKFYFIHSWHLFHSPMASIFFVLTFMSFSHSIFIILK